MKTQFQADRAVARQKMHSAPMCLLPRPFVASSCVDLGPLSIEFALANAKVTAWPSDIAAFIEGRIDEERFAELLWGLCLVDFSGESTGANIPRQITDSSDGGTPPAFYAQLKLCFASRLPEDKRVPIEPTIFNLAASGDGARASAQALRRLHGSSIPVTHIQIPLSGDAARRCAAALLFPL